MKILNIIPLLITAISSRAGGTNALASFDTITFSPLYYFGKESTFVVKATKGYGEVRIYIYNASYEKQLIASKTIKGSGKFTMKYNNQYTLDRNEILVSYKLATKWVDSGKIEMNVVPDSYRYIEDNQNIISNGYISVLNNAMTWSRHKVTYSFTNFDGLYIPDYYHKIRLEDFAINIPSDDRALFSCKPSLIITNVNGIFNDIATTSTVEFPLKLVSTSTGYSFELKDTLYVHKESLMLSLIAKEGYVPTKHIFLPRNDMQNQDKYKAIFSLQDFGVDKCYVRHNFELKALKNIIGDCRNSEYCIQRLEK